MKAHTKSEEKQKCSEQALAVVFVFLYFVLQMLPVSKNKRYGKLGAFDHKGRLIKSEVYKKPSIKSQQSLATNKRPIQTVMKSKVASHKN